MDVVSLHLHWWAAKESSRLNTSQRSKLITPVAKYTQFQGRTSVFSSIAPPLQAVCWISVQRCSPANVRMIAKHETPER